MKHNNPAAAFSGVTTATIASILLKRGLRNVWIRGARHVAGEQKIIAGEAYTMRFIPAREDLVADKDWQAQHSTRTAIEAIPKGAVLVADAMGVTDAGAFGDIMCTRMALRGVAALVTDGAVRDLAGVLESGLNVWSAGVTPAMAQYTLALVDTGQPVSCGGVAILSQDIMVADNDGAVVVPRAWAAEVAFAAREQEDFERWALKEVHGGVPLSGLYPPNEEALVRYKAANPDPRRS